MNLPMRQINEATVALERAATGLLRIAKAAEEASKAFQKYVEYMTTPVVEVQGQEPLNFLDDLDEPKYDRMP